MSAGRGAVVDAWAALAFLRNEKPAADVMRRYLKRAAGGSSKLSMNIVNLGEVYYQMCRLIGEEGATDRVQMFRKLPVTIVQARESLVMEAARLKGRFSMSYADAFAVATARAEGSPVLTGDPEILGLPPDVVRVVRLERALRNG